MYFAGEMIIIVNADKAKSWIAKVGYEVGTYGNLGKKIILYV